MKDKTGLWVSPRHFGGLHQCHWELIHCGHTTKLGVFLSGVTTWWMNQISPREDGEAGQKKPAAEAKYVNGGSKQGFTSET